MMGARDGRWHSACERPKCDPFAKARVIIEYIDAFGVVQTGAGFFASGFGKFYVRCWEEVRATRWMYFPVPPTPGEEERARLEEELIPKMANLILTLKATGLLNTEPYDLDIVRDLAAKGGGA